jgi:four helix bundle protein
LAQSAILLRHSITQFSSMQRRRPGYQTLKIWIMGMDIAEAVYHITSTFPKVEQFGITSQLRRAAVSIPSNIAEGYARRTTPDFLYFVTISAGSVNELQTQLMLSHRLGYLTKEAYDRIIAMVAEESRMLNGMRRSLEHRIGKANH